MSGESSLLSIETPLGDDALLLRKAVVKEQLGSPFSIELDLVSDDGDINLDEIIGKHVAIRLETEKGSRYFNGIVAQFYQRDNLLRTPHYGAEIRPWLWLLNLSENCRIFQEKSYPDIIKAVFDELGFSDYEDRLTGSYSPIDYVVQFNESDFNFVSRLMQQEGIFYYFEHTEKKHTLILVDDNAKLKDSGTVPFFELEETSKHEGVEGITGWQNKRIARAGAIGLRSYDFELPTKDLNAVTSDPLTPSLASMERYNYPGKYTERAAGDQYTRLLMQQENATYNTKRLQGNFRSLFAGTTFTLSEHEREDQNAQYLITNYHCVMRGEAFMADNQDRSKSLFHFSADAIPAKTVYRPEFTAKKPQMAGPQTAKVVGKSGEEIWTDKYGRIKVMFHWDRQAKADENSSCWIRVSQTLSGKNWGTVYTPRIGQEVLVDFITGDPDKPIVVGCVYNGGAMPPYPLPANATLSGFKSRSSKGGNGFNEFRFEDKKDEEQIYLHGQRNMDVRILNDRFETIGNDQHLKITNDKFEKVENNRNEEVGANHSEKITGDKNVNIEGKEAKEIGGTLSLKVSGDVGEKLNSNYSVNVGQDAYIKASNICLEASGNITLKVGGSFIAIEQGGITIKSSGDITVESGANATVKGTASATVEGSGSVEVSSSGIATIKGSMVKIN